MNKYMQGYFKPFFESNFDSGDIFDIQRNFVEFDNVFNTKMSISTPITFNSDFSVSLDVNAYTITSTIQFILGRHDSDRIYLGVLNGNLFYGNGASFGEISNTLVADGKLHKVIFGVFGGDMQIYLDGNMVYNSPLSATLPFTMSVIGEREDGSIGLNGVIADVKITDTTTSETTTFKLDQATANYELSQGASLGGELFSQTVFDSGGFINSTGSVGSNTVTYIASSAFGGYQVFLPSAINNGKLFEFTFDVVSSTDTVVFNVYDKNGDGDADVAALRFGAGKHKFVTSINSLSRYYVRQAQTGIQTTVSNISFKEINGNAVTYVNIAQDKRELFQLSSNETQWDNISPLPQELPSTLEIA